ncbi:hypothetical protein B6U93_01580 [Candidatus Woesearchaeota archaeon ex4484_78]|nr:MAG: hypothetical protein B6U93_01580 [Candidatus Woesearchaeota archaeon ex4484_78]
MPVKKTGFALLVFVALIAGAVLFVNFQNNSISGGFSAAGGGRYYYGSQIVQLMPQDACARIGCESTEPVYVKSGFGGSYTKCLCYRNGVYKEEWVPLIQVINFNKD